MFNGIEIGFLKVHLGDLLDIIVVAILFYQVYKLLRGSLAFNIFIGLLVVYLVKSIAEMLDMSMLSRILREFLGAGFILLAILFQQEIRRFLFYIGRSSGIGTTTFWRNVFRRSTDHHSEQESQKDEITKALNKMASSRTGCLLVFVSSTEKGFFTATGVSINGDISSKLLESIFEKNSPLHDGAAVITAGKILAAGCVLPVSENPDLPPRVGMRHRAAAGISEQIDAHVLIVSEERGKISHAYKGKIRMNLSAKNISDILDTALETSYA